MNLILAYKAIESIYLFVTFLLTFGDTGAFWSSNWVRIRRLLLGTHFYLLITIRLQNGLECYEIALFVGSYIEGDFFGVSSFTKVCLYSYDYYDNSV